MLFLNREAFIKKAFDEKKLLQFKAENCLRIGEVYAVGSTEEGKRLMLFWQIRGASRHGRLPGWRDFHLDDITDLEILDEEDRNSAKGYKGPGKQMHKVDYRK